MSTGISGETRAAITGPLWRSFLIEQRALIRELAGCPNCSWLRSAANRARRSSAPKKFSGPALGSSSRITGTTATLPDGPDAIGDVRTRPDDSMLSVAILDPPWAG